MHDCRTTEGWLVDLVFDELDADERRRLLAELEACARCLDEYRSMAGTLSAFDEAGETILPGESYWHNYHAALGLRFRPAPAVVLAPRRAPFWRRALAARLTVPAPAAALITLALLVSSATALRPRATEVPSPAPQPAAAAQPLTPPPVPVVSERIVTRVVYVEKRRRERRGQRRSSPPAAPNEGKESVQGGLFTRANLTDFQPANELKIRVIKRSNSDEN